MTNQKQLKILMADDELEILEIMERKIGQEGYQVITAQDGQEAWDKIQKCEPDVILLDINMPKMNGFEVLKKLRENPPKKKWQPVIMISARRELEDIKESYSLDADHYITKPCEIRDILKAIKLMLNLVPHRRSSVDRE